MNEFHAEVEKKYPDIQCLHVAEAGSRAWGFESPDSDWDVRFIYAHRDKNRYLKLNDPKEVIIFEDGLVEYHGWDIKKALKLAGKSNVSFYEWAASPTIYLNYPGLLDLCHKTFSLREAAHHYRGMARHTYVEYCSGTGEKTMKKFLYCIRPILCIEHIEKYRSLPPISFEALRKTIPEELQFTDIVERLLHIKTAQTEQKNAPQDIDDYFTKWCSDKLEILTHDRIASFPKKETDWAALNTIYNDVTGLF